MGKASRWCAELRFLAVALVGLGMACQAPRTPVVPAGPDRGPPHAEAGIDWAAGEEWFVRVSRSCRTLSVYNHGQWVRTYHDVAFGRKPGDKEYEGDRRTPLGLYRMVGRRPHPRWSYFILLDYPNAPDREQHRAGLAKGLWTAGPGGEIGIHGSDEPLLNQAGVDWTYGCISLLDDDMAELYREVPEGTLVWIED